MNWKPLYTEHLDAISGSAANALALSAEAGRPFDGIVFHAGETAYYHADDHDIAFKPTPHFARWAPVPGPDHLLLFRPGRRPKLIRVVPEDYWYEAPADPKHPFLKTLDVVTVGSVEAAVKRRVTGHGSGWEVGALVWVEDGIAAAALDGSG